MGLQVGMKMNTTEDLMVLRLVYGTADGGPSQY